MVETSCQSRSLFLIGLVPMSCTDYNQHLHVGSAQVPLVRGKRRFPSTLLPSDLDLVSPDPPTRAVVGAQLNKSLYTRIIALSRRPELYARDCDLNPSSCRVEEYELDDSVKYAA